MVQQSMMRGFVVGLLETTAQGLSGAVAYYSCEFLSDYFTFREGINPQVAKLFFWFFFPLLAVSALVLVTMFWYRFQSRQGKARYPEFPVVIGAIIFMPVYFELASHLIYNPAPIVVSEVADSLLWMYLLFPLTIMDIGSYTLTMHVLGLAVVSALVGGLVLRSRMRPSVLVTIRQP